MSETDRAQEIHEATIRKLNAEADKFLADAAAATSEGEANTQRLKAEASRLEEETLQLAAERHRLQLDIANLKIDHDNKLRDQQEKLAGNEYHRTFNFVDDVSDSSVRECIKRCNQWRRIGAVEGHKPEELPIEIEFFSPGGDVISGLRLFDYFQECRRAGHKLTTGTRGYAASMAGILLQAGDVRWMGKEAWVLIHEISAMTIGKVPEMKDRLKWMERIQDRVINIFIARAMPRGGKDADHKWTDEKELRAFMTEKWSRTDWWLSSDECFLHGFVDEIR